MSIIDASLEKNRAEKIGPKPVIRRVLSRRQTSSAPSSAHQVRADSIAADILPSVLSAYLEDCAIERHSPKSIINKKDRIGKLIWFVQRQGYDTVGTAELRKFFLYLNDGHNEPGGRWGKKDETRPVTSGTVKSYHSSLRAFFNHLIDERRIEISPMERMAVPVDRPDQIQPFSTQQIDALYAAASQSAYPARDTALLLLLLDTGLRVSEIVGLIWEDLDLPNGEVVVRFGKGGKRRVVPVSRETKKALYAHMATLEGHLQTDAVFISERGRAIGAALGALGVQRVVKRMAARARISGVRCSPHTFRHTFSIMFLRNGGNVFTLKQILGHESLAMTNRYVAIAQADISAQHRDYSPVEGMGLGRKKKSVR